MQQLSFAGGAAIKLYSLLPAKSTILEAMSEDVLSVLEGILVFYFAGHALSQANQ
jgi:hypothetical protein